MGVILLISGYIRVFSHRGVTFTLARSGGRSLKKQVLFFLFFGLVGEGIDVGNDLMEK